MKNIILLLAVLLALKSKAQVTYEKTYSRAKVFTVVNIEGDGHKYLILDSFSNNVQLYNPNHTPWKLINTTVPSGSVFYNVSCVSKKLMNTDDQIELSFSYYTDFPNFRLYTTKIYREDGSTILEAPEIAYLNPVRVNNDWKLIGYKPHSNEHVVFGVPGQYLGIPKTGNNDASAMLYPNPMDAAATLKYKLPTGTRYGKISVYNMQGGLVRDYDITDHFSEILIQRGDLPAGVYNYKITAGGNVMAGERFAVK